MTNKLNSKLFLPALLIFALAQTIAAQTATFIYQGRLTDSALFVNPFKEQQSQIEPRRTQVERQQKQIDELKRIVCALKPDAEVCK